MFKILLTVGLWSLFTSAQGQINFFSDSMKQEASKDPRLTMKQEGVFAAKVNGRDVELNLNNQAGFKLAKSMGFLVNMEQVDFTFIDSKNDTDVYLVSKKQGTIKNHTLKISEVLKMDEEVEMLFKIKDKTVFTKNFVIKGREKYKCIYITEALCEK